MRSVAALFALVCLCLSSSTTTAAPAKLEPSGFELALHGSTRVLKGERARFRGMAYRVFGLATLRPLPRAWVRARITSKVGKRERRGPWLDVRADQRGFFILDVPMPKKLEGALRLEIRVGDGKRSRLLRFPLSVHGPSWLLDLRTDRQLYQPGEPLHVWARLRDRRSRRPLAARRLRVSLTGAMTAERTLLTGASGAAWVRLTVPAQAAEGSCVLTARIGKHEVTHRFRVGTRTYERLFGTVSVSPKTARPHQKITVKVLVTTASGALVRGARVKVKVDEGEAQALTDDKGVATLAMQAPAYMSHATGRISIRAELHHPAHGSKLTFGSLGLAVPHTVEVEALPQNAGLVPELASALYLRVKDGAGAPPPPGTRVEVRGAAMVGGRQSALTDKHGMVRLKARLPRGAASRGRGGKASTTVVVSVAAKSGKDPRIVSRVVAVSVPVLRHVEVIPSVSKPVVAPGEVLQVSIKRHPKVRRRAVIVELLAGKTLLAASIAPRGVRRVSLRAPWRRLGVIRVRARALHQRGTSEGAGGVDAFLVRPRSALFPRLTADKKLYRVKSTARLTLHTRSPQAPSTTSPSARPLRVRKSSPQAKSSLQAPSATWAAVVVRDLAAHNGERPFSLRFLSGAFDRAILEPHTATAETLLRAALASYLYEDRKPRAAPPLLDALGLPARRRRVGSDRRRGVLRDPFPLADELSRRGVGRVMRALERDLAKALDKGLLDSVTKVTRPGGRRGFKQMALNDHVFETLGGQMPALAMLEASDPSFTYDNVARRVARLRLVRLMVALAKYLDPGDRATVEQRRAAREPPSRWLPRMVQCGLIKATALADPWGGSFTLRRTAKPALLLAPRASTMELVSAGPDGKYGTKDDVRDPFARAVPANTPYAVASGEDALMRTLARLAPGKEALKRLLAAYDRVPAEVEEERKGDAVDADAEDALGALLGGDAGESYGVGGLGLSGVGRGGGGSGSGTIGLGSLGTIGRGGGAGGLSGFAQVIRERFPPTLYFAPALKVSQGGTTPISLKLSDAVTTYLVEAIVWSADGWTWSAKTRIRVDKETVIDAPVPRHATVGDVLHLPLRVGNQGNRKRTLSVAVYAPGKSDAPAVQKSGIEVPARGAVALPVELKLPRAVDGKVSVGLLSEKGVALDAVRRKITVRRPMRRVRRSVERLVSGKATLRLEVPKRAMERGGAEVSVRVGAGLFALTAHEADWVAAWTGEARAPVSRSTVVALRQRSLAPLAWAVGTTWSSSSVRDYLLSRALRRITRGLSRSGLSLRQRARVLLMLAPAIRRVGARPKLASNLAAVVRTLRATVQTRVASVSGDVRTLALAAAALAATAPPSKGGAGATAKKLSRVRELVRRLRRHQIRVGNYTWIATRQVGRAASALLALAELLIGERGRALRLLSTLAHFELAEESTMGGLRSWTKALASVGCWLLRGGWTPTAARLEIDGEATTVELRGGVARVPAVALGRPGRHRVVVDFAAGAAGAGPVLSHVRISTEYGLPWSLRPARPGALSVAIEGESRGLDQRAGLSLLVSNRSPRCIAAPVLELGLPAGAELDEQGRSAMGRTLAAGPHEGRGTLRLVLTALPPGATRRIPLPLRWSVAGRLSGLGVAAYPKDRPEDLTVRPPRVWTIEAKRGAK